MTENQDRKDYIEKARQTKPGDYIFTCGILPVKFDKWLDQEKINFTTRDGLEHNIFKCSLTRVSRKYAIWYIKNNFEKKYDDIVNELSTKDYLNGKNWTLFEEHLKRKCEQDNVTYEGY